MSHRLLTAIRSNLARSIAATLSRVPRLERAYVRLARPASRLPLMPGLLAHANDDLVQRLRRRGDRYRLLSVGGMELWLDVTDTTGFGHYFERQPYEPELAGYLGARLHDGDVFVDIGANIGFFSVLAARRVGRAGRVVAFEPNPHARASLAQLAERNGVRAFIEIVPLALADKPAEGQPLYVTDSSALSTLDPTRSPVRQADAFQQSVAVDVTTVDQWLGQRPELLSRIAVIKIDVEGVEEKVIAGMERTLAQLSRVDVILETSDRSSADRRLKAAGFVSRPLDLYDAAHGYGNHLYSRQPVESPLLP